MKLNLALRTAMAQTISNLSSSGATYLRVYTGTAPANADAAATGTLLWEHDVVGYFNPTNGVATLTNVPFTSNALATGTAGWARFTDNYGSYAVDMSVGLTGAEVNMSTVEFTINVAASLNSMTFTQPAN